MVTKAASTAHASLTGIRVVELGSSVAAPYATWVMAQLGAEVIKVEPPGRGDDARYWGKFLPDGSSSYFNALNSNKLGITVDLKDPDDLQWLKDYCASEVDVVIQNMRPGRAGKYGLGGEDLTVVNPRLIYCNLWAFGSHGPLKDNPGYDPLMQAYGGIMSITGNEGEAPIRVGTSIVDMGTGLWCVIGILNALGVQKTTGRGCIVDASLYETAVAWMTNSVASVGVDGERPLKQGSGARGIAPYQAYKCKDGHLVIAAPNNHLFGRLAKILGHPEWTDDRRFDNNPNRYANLTELNELMEPIIEKQTRRHWQNALDDAGVPSAPVQTVPEMMQNPQTEALGMLQNIGEGIKLMAMPLSFNGVRPPLRHYAPALGEHNIMVKSSQIKGEE
tara:strand:- start:359 stop:1528 length:1170 start_codon:yes stop_codon:yes gene_type:complete